MLTTVPISTAPRRSPKRQSTPGAGGVKHPSHPTKPDQCGSTSETMRCQLGDTRKPTTNPLTNNPPPHRRRRRQAPAIPNQGEPGRREPPGGGSGKFVEARSPERQPTPDLDLRCRGRQISSSPSQARTMRFQLGDLTHKHLHPIPCPTPLPPRCRGCQAPALSNQARLMWFQLGDLTFENLHLIP